LPASFLVARFAGQVKVFVRPLDRRLRCRAVQGCQPLPHCGAQFLNLCCRDIHPATPVDAHPAAPPGCGLSLSRAVPTQYVEPQDPDVGASMLVARSEEHTSELQSRENLVCRLLLEKK